MMRAEMSLTQREIFVFFCARARRVYIVKNINPTHYIVWREKANFLLLHNKKSPLLGTFLKKLEIMCYFLFSAFLMYELTDFIEDKSELGIFPGMTVFCALPKPKTDAIKFCLISLIMVCRFVSGGKVAAFLRPSLSNFQPNIILNNRIKNVKMLEAKANTPAQKNILRKVFIDSASYAHEPGLFGS